MEAKTAATKDSFTPFLYVLIGVVAVSFSAIFIRLTDTPPLVTAFYRQVFCAVLIFPFVGRDSESVLPPKDYLLLVVSGFFLAVHFATWITGLFFTSVARATLFVDLQPVWAALLGFLFLKERLSGLEIIGVLLVTLGGITTIGGKWSEPLAAMKGDLLALTGGVAGACYLLIGRKVRNKISWVRYIYSVYYLSGIWLLLFHLLFFRNFPFPLEADIPWIVLMAIVPGILGHGLFNLAIRSLKTYVVNAAFLGEPILATLFAYFLFHEQPDGYYYAGAALIFVGLAIIFWKERK
jgi:drug/metabolite transporter (DMT)-like permease